MNNKKDYLGTVEERHNIQFETRVLVVLSMTILLFLGFEVFENTRNIAHADYSANNEVNLAEMHDEDKLMCSEHPNYRYEVEPMTTPLHLALARIFVSEGGYDGTRDYMPIFIVLKNRSQGGTELTLENMMRYSPKSFTYGSNHFAKYIPYLNEQGTEPRFWRERYPDTPWENYREKWIRALEISWNILNGHSFRNHCNGRVDHWGADRPDMIQQALQNGLTRVSCHGTRNAFWRI